METSWKLVGGAGAGAVLIAIMSGLTMVYLLRPTTPAPASGSNGAAIGQLDITPESDQMAEPRRGIVEYLRTPSTSRVTAARIGTAAPHVRPGVRGASAARARPERECGNSRDAPSC